MSKVFTLEEVEKHTKLKDLWVIINGNVYDLSLYADEHPGGVDAILFVAGKDGTEDFYEASHSEESKMELEKYYIGTIKKENE